ncbi:Auxilin-related protein 1 [Linum perenne]
MDEFGVLTERFGLKPQGKSAPMAASKRPSSAAAAPNRTRPDSGFNNHRSSNHAYGGGGANSFSNGSFVGNGKAQSFGSSSVDGFDIFDGFDNGSKQKSNGSVSSFDYNSIFSGTNHSNGGSSFNNDDIFGGIGGLGSSNSGSNDDIFGSFGSKTKQGGPIDDLLGNFGSNSGSGSVNNRNGSSGFDDWVPGFSSSRTTSDKGSAAPGFSSADDPFVVLESTSTATNSSFVDPIEELTKFGRSTKPASSPNVSSSLKPPPKPGQVLKSVKVRSSSSFDKLEDFATGKVRATPNRQPGVNHPKQGKERENGKTGKFRAAEDAVKKAPQKNVDDLDSIFAMGSISSSMPKSKSTTSLDPLFNANVSSKVSNVKAAAASSGMKKASSTANMFDDFSSLFGDVSLSGEFQEVEGETEERRKARLERHQRTKHRVAQAVADMNQRDYQTQREQEERRMIAEKMDLDIKRWATGKEGNMRALLSSLQYVLWKECGWVPVSLTDLITSSSVKKVYRKATLCVHPDKVQQKGATLEQKYIAEKVFDILKEAWNKFNKEELS